MPDKQSRRANLPNRFPDTKKTRNEKRPSKKTPTNERSNPQFNPPNPTQYIGARPRTAVSSVQLARPAPNQLITNKSERTKAKERKKEKKRQKSDDMDYTNVGLLEGIAPPLPPKDPRRIKKTIVKDQSTNPLHSRRRPGEQSDFDLRQQQEAREQEISTGIANMRNVLRPAVTNATPGDATPGGARPDVFKNTIFRERVEQITTWHPPLITPNMLSQRLNTTSTFHTRDTRETTNIIGAIRPEGNTATLTPNENTTRIRVHRKDKPRKSAY